MNGERGEATGGTASTIVDTNDGQDGTWANDQWNGYLIKIVDGTNSIVALKQYGEKEIDGLIHRGEIYENNGKLFNLC